MDKVIYKQTNKIVLALLTLGGMVHASTYWRYVPTFCGHRRLGISEAFTPVVPGDIGHNEDVISHPSLPGSSGDIHISAPTPATDNMTSVISLSGSAITTLPQGINLSAAIELTRAALAHQGKTGGSIQLVEGTQPIINDEQFSKAGNILQYVLIGPVTIVNNVYIVDRSKVDTSVLADVLNVPDLSAILDFISCYKVPTFMTGKAQIAFRTRFPNLNGFSGRFFNRLYHTLGASHDDDSKLMMVGVVGDIPPMPTTEPEKLTAEEVLKSKAREVLQLIL